ncbi:NepR family anti-sigma factor [Sphingomonas sp. FW199]|uniref:NepR family anti-sigma factor n=1 Tax=Sphingomonas sp. FW199 TaxID=3400217 RepID=UPI003CEBE099
MGSTDKRTGKAVTDAQTTKPGSRKPAAARDVGDALRAVYHDAVDESIPRELLDLLNKLS